MIADPRVGSWSSSALTNCILFALANFVRQSSLWCFADRLMLLYMYSDRRHHHLWRAVILPLPILLSNISLAADSRYL